MSKELADSLPIAPIDGHTLTYWTTYDNRLTCIRMTYYLNTKWADHPWSRAYKIDTGGADFEDDWCIEASSDGTNFTSTGRACGWNIRDRLRHPTAHETKQQAARELHDRLAQRLSRLEADVRTVNEQLAVLSSMF